MTTKSAPCTALDYPELNASTHYHGDLRKGAYLRRRADYQLQAQSAPTGQAGETDTMPQTQVAGAIQTS